MTCLFLYFEIYEPPERTKNLFSDQKTPLFPSIHLLSDDLRFLFFLTENLCVTVTLSNKEVSKWVVNK